MLELLNKSLLMVIIDFMSNKIIKNSKGQKNQGGLKKRLITAFLLIGMLSMLVTAFIATWQASNNITDQAYDHLESMAR